MPRAGGYREAWLCCGRRSGKSLILATVAVYLACFKDWAPHLARGERGTIMVLAADRKQARAILNFVRGLLEVPLLAGTIEAEGQEHIRLKNRIDIEVHTSSFRSVRGYAIVAALLDEVSVWPTDNAADPDYEVLAALRPGMLTIPGSMLLCASSPYARRGALFDAHKTHFGKEDSDVLVWQAPTRAMNPRVSQAEIDREIARDPARATAEYGATFRTDVEAFLTREAVTACITPGVRERGPIAGVQYYGFVDPSGGSEDSFTMAISHRDGDIVVIDALREVKPPFSPEGVVREFAKMLKSYRISTVRGDHYAGEWPREQFRKRGIEYRAAGKNRSEFYIDLLPVVNSRRLELPDNERLVAQLCSLERRTARSGRDSIDHAPGQHDDLANAVAGAVGSAMSHRDEVLPIVGPKVWNRAGALVADGVSSFFERLKPAPTTNEELHQANLRQQHAEMREFVEPHVPPFNWDEPERPMTESEVGRRLQLHGKLFVRGRMT
jgi:hypothetical protein